jgi:hypothetical protein
MTKEINKRLTKLEIMNALTQQIEDGRLWDLNYSKLAEDLGCCRQTIAKYVIKIMEEINPISAKKAKFGIFSSFIVINKQLTKILHSPDSRSTDKIRAAEVLASANSKFMDFLVPTEDYKLEQKSFNVIISDEAAKLISESDQRIN